MLARSEGAVPSGWVRCALRGWSLGVHPTLPVTEMRANDGAEVGWLLGSPIKENGEWVERSVHLPFGSHAAPEEMETWLYRLCGRFLAVWLSPSYQRVYMDAGGTLSAVFSPGHDLVASTPSLVPPGRGCDDDIELLQGSGFPHVRAILGFGLTSRFGVERLVPNHYLDLNRWAARRHWPAGPLDETVDPGEAVQIVSRLIERQVAAATRNGSTYAALTAGFDSRSILACSREYLSRIQFITIAIPDRTGKLDVDMATRLARRHGLMHRVISYLPPTKKDLDAWLWRTGSSVGEPRGWKASLSYRQLDPSISEISGVAGETARVAYWRDGGEGKTPITPEVLADSLNLPLIARVVDRARAWMNDYPATTPVQLLDGFYIEHGVGGWAGGLSYGDGEYVRSRIYPFISRDAVSAMMRLPDAYKLEHQFPLDLIRHGWPELAKTPFNRRPGIRRHVDRLRRYASLGRRALATRPRGR